VVYNNIMFNTSKSKSKPNSESGASATMLTSAEQRYRWTAVTNGSGFVPRSCFYHSLAANDRYAYLFGGRAEQCNGESAVSNSLSLLDIGMLLQQRSAGSRHQVQYRTRCHVDTVVHVDSLEWQDATHSLTPPLPARYGHSSCLVGEQLVLYGGRTADGTAVQSIIVVNLGRPATSDVLAARGVRLTASAQCIDGLGSSEQLGRD
jgi:hypothetical protein